MLHAGPLNKLFWDAFQIQPDACRFRARKSHLKPVPVGFCPSDTAAICGWGGGGLKKKKKTYWWRIQTTQLFTGRLHKQRRPTPTSVHHETGDIKSLLNIYLPCQVRHLIAGEGRVAPPSAPPPRPSSLIHQARPCQPPVMLRAKAMHEWASFFKIFSHFLQQTAPHATPYSKRSKAVLFFLSFLQSVNRKMTQVEVN